MIIVEYETDIEILREAAAAVPEMTLKFESERIADRTTAERGTSMRLLFWASGGEFDRFEAALEADPTVENPKLLAEVEGARLYRVEYPRSAAERSPYSRWVELDGTVLQAERNADRWLVRMGFPDRRAIRAYREWFEDRGIAFRVRQIYETDAAPSDRWIGLSEKQAEALVLAWRRGYFEVPRGCTAAELAEEMGISAQAVSERLRRGTAVLIEDELVPLLEYGEG